MWESTPSVAMNLPQNPLSNVDIRKNTTVDFGETPGTIRVLDARRQGVMTEAYE